MNIYCFSTLSFAKLQFKSVINKAFHKHGVASFTDAWIETLCRIDTSHQLHSRIFYRCVDWNINCNVQQFNWRVASFTDAWIETMINMSVALILSSHLLQMRGLKPYFLIFMFSTVKSHLLQMRGLKQKPIVPNNALIGSHLLQMRGLKRQQ